MGCKKLRPPEPERPNFVLLVGGDDSDAQRCARLAAPLPVVRARLLATAFERVRSLKPVAVVVAANIAAESGSVALLSRATRARVVELAADDVSRTLASASAQRR